MIRFRVFGALELTSHDGSDVSAVLSHSKHAALLAYLAVGNHGTHRRDRLTSLLWPDLDDARARNALSKALHHLRRALGDEALTIRGSESVGINSGAVWCDSTTFENAIAEGRDAEALQLYRRGELMEGFVLGNENGFEQWLESARSRLCQKAVAAAQRLADAAEHASDLRSAVQWSRVACEFLPHDEAALRRLLDRMGRMGDRAGALKAYRAFANQMARDLDLEPSAETRALAESLRAPRDVASAELPARVPGIKRKERRRHDDAGASSVPLDQIPDKRGGRYQTIAGSAVAVAALAVSAFLYAGAADDDPDLVAVGLLTNNTGSPTLDPVADMAMGNIVNQLTQSGQRVVDVRGGATTAESSGKNRELASSAGAGKVVGGNMYKKGDSLVVQMNITDVTDGRVLHQLEPITVPATNAYTILERLRGGVTGAVAALADTLYLPWTTAHSRPPNYAAFQEFMQGLDAIVNQGARPAMEHLKKAISLDTGFVEAKLWLMEQADAFPEERRLVDSVKAVALAQRATMAPFDQVSFDRQVAFLEGDWERAYTASRRLVAMAPKTPDAHVFHAQSAMATRRFGEAITVLHRIDRTKGWLRNLQQIPAWDLQAHRLNGDLRGALLEWRRARAANPADYSMCSNGILILSAMGRESTVDSLVQECASLPTSPPTADRAWEQAGRGFRSRGYTSASRRAFQRSLALRTAAAAKDPKRRRALSAIQCELGMWKEAYENLRATADTASPDDRRTLGVVAAHVGDSAAVSAHLKWLDDWGRRERTRGGSSMARGFIRLAERRTEDALHLLRQATREGIAPPWTAWYIRFELEPLRGDPRFEEMVRPRA